MKALAFISFVFLAVAPIAVRAQMSPAMIGAGPHGYDFLIGEWSCTNSMPSPMGGPASTKFVAAKTAMGSISVHVTGTNFELFAYVAYNPKTKTWWNPAAYANGDSSSESSAQTGRVTRWTGTYYDASGGTTTSIRDTYTGDSMSKYVDLSEAKVGGVWKTQGKLTCTKS